LNGTVERNDQAGLKRENVWPMSRGSLQILVAWTCIALITYGGYILQVKIVTVSSLFLLIVVAVASLCGFWQASFTSILAVACLDYFFMPPVLHFDIQDPQDWASLGAFQITALIISRLSAKEASSAGEATFHRVGMEKLYELSRNSLLLDLHEPPGLQLAVLIQRIFDLRAVALFDKTSGRQDRVGDWGAQEPDLAQQWWLRDTEIDDIRTGTSYRIVQDASESLGAMALRGKLNPLVVDALASLSAIAFDRHRSFGKEELAYESKKSEQLRTAVMDSLGHELKTPLATVQAASSGLLELGGLNDSQFELVKLIDDETLRLSELCTKLLLTAKLESKRVEQPEDEIDFQGLVSAVLSTHAMREIKHRVDVRIEDSAATVLVDRALLAMVMTQYLDNARKYSAPGTSIKITARKSGGELILSVHNRGSNIRIEDRERIFDRFYRAQGLADSVPGTGIGLSIVRKAVEAHRGHVWVVSDDKEGTVFSLSLPVSERSER
jgi:two-component system, OmpR family, sensor histidine kinase KdpD